MDPAPRDPLNQTRWFWSHACHSGFSFPEAIKLINKHSVVNWCTCIIDIFHCFCGTEEYRNQHFIYNQVYNFWIVIYILNYYYNHDKQINDKYHFWISKDFSVFFFLSDTQIEASAGNDNDPSCPPRFSLGGFSTTGTGKTGGKHHSALKGNKNHNAREECWCVGWIVQGWIIFWR